MAARSSLPNSALPSLDNQYPFYKTFYGRNLRRCVLPKFLTEVTSLLTEAKGVKYAQFLNIGHQGISYKFFTDVIVAVSSFTRVFAIAFHFHTSLIFASTAEA